MKDLFACFSRISLLAMGQGAYLHKCVITLQRLGVQACSLMLFLLQLRKIKQSAGLS